jgi:hypothetical protein
MIFGNKQAALIGNVAFALPPPLRDSSANCDVVGELWHAKRNYEILLKLPFRLVTNDHGQPISSCCCCCYVLVIKDNACQLHRPKRS